MWNIENIAAFGDEVAAAATTDTPLTQEQEANLASLGNYIKDPVESPILVLGNTSLQGETK
jgi:hypothetical protein